MSVVVLSNKQMAEWMSCCRDSVNTYSSSDNHLVHMVFGGVLDTDFHAKDIFSLESRHKELEQFMADCVKWNLRSYVRRYNEKWNDSKINQRVDMVMQAQAEPCSNVQAFLTMKSLLYNSDFDSYVEDSEELLSEYKLWRCKLEKLISNWSIHILMRYIDENTTYNWLY